MKRYKKDIIVVSILLVVALGCYLYLNVNNNKSTGYVQVYREDSLIKTYQINQNGKYEIKTGNDINQIIIENGSVSMKDANCPDKLCVRQGTITKNGESIICLPHKLVVKISSEEGRENE